MNPGIAFHEDILQRIPLDPNQWSGGADYSLFKHSESHLFFTQAYGRPQARYVCWCVNPVRSEFWLDEVFQEPDRQTRYLLKVVATWQNWKKAVQPIRILVNGKSVYDGPFFLETILIGWPSQYIELPPDILCLGKNKIEISSGSGDENVLLLAQAEVLRQPDLVDFTIHSIPEAVRAGEEFWIKLHLLQPYPDISVVPSGGEVEFLGRKEDLFRFRAIDVSEDVRITFADGEKTCEAVLDRISPVRALGRLPISIGMDGAEVRHDSTSEMDRVLSHFIYSRIGNYFGFRPSWNRSYCHELRPGQERWMRWIEQCRDHGIYMHYSGDQGECLDGLDFEHAAGEYFSGYQFHEPYLVFQPFAADLLMTEGLKAADNFLEKKEAYVEYLRTRADRERKGDAPVFSGEPALTCIYSAEAGVDALLCEPVSNISLLYGAARGTGIKFGAHIPADWYFGYPHDEVALRRLQLAVWQAYAYGGEIVYVESSLFQTDANERNDWEHPYCTGVRHVMREFYRLAHLDDRVGRPQVPLAFIYGNLESMFWMDDDRIPETVDMGDWDRLHWGMPGETPHRRIWTASEAWLPRVPLPEPHDESLTRLFTGTPFGGVDLVTPGSSLSRYRAVAFLGWNTMTNEIYERLLSFVQNGGTLFICGCHLDTRIEKDASVAILNGGAVSALIGADIVGPGEELLPGVRACELNTLGAKRMDENFWMHKVGLGNVYFGNFYDYPVDFSLINQISDLLKRIGEDVRSSNPLQVETSSPYVHYTIWEHDGGCKVYAMDTDWRRLKYATPATITLTKGEQMERFEIAPGELIVLDGHRSTLLGSLPGIEVPALAE